MALGRLVTRARAPTLGLLHLDPRRQLLAYCVHAVTLDTCPMDQVPGVPTIMGLVSARRPDMSAPT